MLAPAALRAARSGSGAVKVFAMDEAMKVPFKVSTTTSNFMIGVTAAASAGIYLIADISILGWPCRSCWAYWQVHSSEPRFLSALAPDGFVFFLHL